MNILKRTGFVVACLCALQLITVSQPAGAADDLAGPSQGEGIAAVVNDEPITMSAVYDRMKLMMASSGMPNTPEIQAKLKTQVVNMLIDETLQMQEAKRLSLSVTPEEVANGFATVAQQNKFTAQQFQDILVHSGIRLNTLQDQIKAQIAWGKVIQRKLRPQVEVNANDVDEQEKFLKSNIGKTQYLIAEIFLPVDNAQQDPDVKALAEKIIHELKDNHAPFQRLAVQFSQEAAAARGGDLGWLQDSELPEQIRPAVAAMNEGDLSVPLRSLTGYHIILVRGKRTVQAENIPSKDEIMNQIGTDRLDRLQRSYLMDLKAEAFVERRV